jgi:hypothetical protein
MYMIFEYREFKFVVLWHALLMCRNHDGTNFMLTKKLQLKGGQISMNDILTLHRVDLFCLKWVKSLRLSEKWNVWAIYILERVMS